MSQSHIKLHAFKDKTIFSLLSKQFLLLYSQDYSYILTCQKMLGKFSALSYPFFFLVSKLLPRHISDHSQTVLDSTHLTKFKFHFLCSKHQTLSPGFLNDFLNGSLQMHAFSLCSDHSTHCIQIILPEIHPSYLLPYITSLSSSISLGVKS